MILPSQKAKQKTHPIHKNLGFFFLRTNNTIRNAQNENATMQCVLLWKLHSSRNQFNLLPETPKRNVRNTPVHVARPCIDCCKCMRWLHCKLHLLPNAFEAVFPFLSHPYLWDQFLDRTSESEATWASHSSVALLSQ